MPSFTSAFAGPAPLFSNSSSVLLGSSSHFSSLQSSRQFGNGRPKISSRRSKLSPTMIAFTRKTSQGDVKRIVVTGAGVVSCFGSDADTFYQALLDGKSGAKKVENFDVDGWSTNFAAFIDPAHVDTEGYVSPKLMRRMDPFLTYALVAGKKALEDAGIGIGSEAFKAVDKSRAGVLCGSGMGGLNIYSEGVEKLITSGHRRMSPFFIPYAITNMVCVSTLSINAICMTSFPLCAFHYSRSDQCHALFSMLT